MSDFTRVANQLRTIMQDKRQKMSRVVLAGERFAKKEAPVKRGTLRRSITSRVERGGDRGVIGTNLGYARAVHDGSRPHVIKPKRPVKVVNGRKVYPALKTPYGIYRSVRHPGYKGNPFFERTARRLRDVAAAEFGRDIFRGVR